MLVMIALVVIVVVAAAYTLASVGMNMSAITMTKMDIEMPGMNGIEAVKKIKIGQPAMRSSSS